MRRRCTANARSGTCRVPGAERADAARWHWPELGFCGDGMGVRLADQDEVDSLGRHGAAKRLVAVEIVAEDDRIQPAAFPALSGQSALGGIDLAVLLLRAFLRGDERRGQRNDARLEGGIFRVFWRGGTRSISPHQPGEAPKEKGPEIVRALKVGGGGV